VFYTVKCIMCCGGGAKMADTFKQLLLSPPSQPPAQRLRFGWPVIDIARFTNSSTYLLIYFLPQSGPKCTWGRALPGPGKGGGSLKLHCEILRIYRCFMRLDYCNCMRCTHLDFMSSCVRVRDCKPASAKSALLGI